MVISLSLSQLNFSMTGDFEAMRNCFKSLDWAYVFSEKSVDEMWEIIHNHVHTAVVKFVPHRSFKTGHRARSKPVWMNERVMSRIKRKKKSFQRYKETRDGKDYLEYVIARNAAKTETRKAV